ncbi:MAG: hypothetical protein QTN59_20325 [Candidatus Electrothrix communis]|nr:hypothetical protein [Desulfobulbus sp. US4]WLE97008.1 MAG: hypothetical protein QTN59_20325 [Candidatus Electrothrix communis]
MREAENAFSSLSVVAGRVVPSLALILSVDRPVEEQGRFSARILKNIQQD